MNQQIIPDAKEVRDCLLACARRAGEALGGQGALELITEEMGHNGNNFTSSATYAIPYHTPIGWIYFHICMVYYSSNIRRIDMRFEAYQQTPSKVNKQHIPLNFTWQATQTHNIATHRRVLVNDVALYNMSQTADIGHASYFFDPMRPSEGQLTDFRVLH